MIRRLLLWLISRYRTTGGGMRWFGIDCNFEPSCSAYSLQALEKNGAVGGSYLTLKRIGRCHPWCDGGLDPIPEHAPKLFGFPLTKDK